MQRSWKQLIRTVGALALLVVYACGDSAAGDGAAGVSGGGQGGNAGSWPGAYGPNSCVLPLPDPGDDECLACALEHCCGPESGVCLSKIPEGGYPDDAETRTNDASCYQDYFVGCMKGCFERLRQESTESSWRVAARCNKECFGGDAPGYFYANTLTLCLIGTTVPDEDLDGGSDTDAGLEDIEPWCPASVECNYPRSPCVEKCFPGWTD